MLGFSKSFAVVLLVAILLGWRYGWQFGLSIMTVYAVIRIIWKFLTE